MTKINTRTSITTVTKPIINSKLPRNKMANKDDPNKLNIGSVCVVTDMIALQEEADHDSKVLGVLEKDTEFHVMEIEKDAEDPNIERVRIVAGMQVGWISNDLS